MPAFETMDLKQKAVLWAVADDGTPDDFDDHGEHKVKAAKEISCRWVEKHTEVVDNDGNTIALDAEVVVGIEVKIGSILRLGKQTELPSPLNKLYEVVVIATTPDIKNRNTRRTLLLRRYSDELPTIKS